MAKAIGGFLRLLLLLFLAAKGGQTEDAHVGSTENYRDEEDMVSRDELESDPYTPDGQPLWSPELFDWEDSDLKANDSSSSNSTADEHEEETSENVSSEKDVSNTISYSEEPPVEDSGCPFEQQPRSRQPHKEPQQSTCQPQVPQQSKCPHRVPHKHNCLSKASMKPDKLDHISMQESKKLGMPGHNDHQPERYQQERSYPPWWLQEPHLEYLSKWPHPLAWLYNWAQELNQQGHPPVWSQETHRGCKTKVAPQGCQSQTLPYQYFQNPMISHQNFHPRAPPQGFYSQESPQPSVHPRAPLHLGHWLNQHQGEQPHSQPTHHRQTKEKWQGPPQHHRQPQVGVRQGPPHHHIQPQVEPWQGPPHHHPPQPEPRQGPPQHHQPQPEPWQSFRPQLPQGKQHLPQPPQQWAEPHFGQPPHQSELKPHGIHPGYHHWPRAEMHPLYQHNQAQENLQTHFQPDQSQPELSYSHQPQPEYGHALPYHQPETEFNLSPVPHQLPPHGHPSHRPVEPHQFKPQEEQQYGHQAELPVPQSHGNLPEGQEAPAFTKKPRYLPKRPPLKARWPVYKPSAQHH